MAKITRANQKIFGSNAGANQIATFGSLAASSPAFTTNPETIQSLSEYLTGWFGAVIGANSPAIEDMNALCYLYSYQLAYLMQTGVAEWNDETTYYIGSLVSDGVDGIFASKTDTNLNNALPSLEDTNWKKITGSNFIDGNIFTEGTLTIQNGNMTALLGADLNASTLTNATRKFARIATPHYTNAEEPVGAFVVDANTTTNDLYIGGGTSSVNAATSIIFRTAANSTTTSGTTRLIIDSSGDFNFQSGDLTTTGNFTSGVTNLMTGAAANLEVYDTNTTAAVPGMLVLKRTIGAPGTSGHGIQFQHSSGVLNGKIEATYSSSDPTLRGALDFYAGYSGANALAMRIKGDGNIDFQSGSLTTTGSIGVGVASAAAKVKIQGAGNTDSTYSLFITASDTTNIMFVNDAGEGYFRGDVGIGTTNPAFSAGSGLEIQRAGTATLRLENTTDSKSIELRQTATYFQIQGANAQDIILGTTSRIGIGLTTPARPLELNSNFAGACTEFENSSATASGVLIDLSANAGNTTQYLLRGDNSGGTVFTLYSNGYLVQGQNTVLAVGYDTVAQNVATGGTITVDASYILVNGSSGPSNDVLIANGSYPGQWLILEGNSGANTVNMTSIGNKKLSAALFLGQYDTITLVWNGTYWIEVSRSNN